MKQKKWMTGLGVIILATSLAACGDTADDTSMEMSEEQSMDHSSMNHSGSGEIPDGLMEASDPTYPVGSTAMMTADHMPGMEGVEATIVGAYDTTVYAVSYTPTTGGDPVENHKWVIHEELENPGDAPLEKGEQVVLAADHMEGMDGAEATIDTAEETTVYMVDYTTEDGEEVTNHKWVTESELEAMK
ncbi:YdhK family protein [Exiguobacterium aestuarii]|uniref:YdhK family protein n=1 Tax=Exiguobacterium aestuarii TaxID=273527 RepID=UPI001CD35B90|nr:YdhK family protein [Exiguobacterium aestuarii]MCA0981619.1 YdhK family protein [Exiguobacterium aestuarii]